MHVDEVPEVGRRATTGRGATGRRIESEAIPRPSRRGPHHGIEDEAIPRPCRRAPHPTSPDPADATPIGGPR